MGCDGRGVHFHKCASWQVRGRHECLRWPSPRARRPIRQKVKGVTADWRRLPFPLEAVVATLNPILRGGGQSFKVGNSSRTFVAVDRSVFPRLALVRRRTYPRRRRD
ncbi:group II intron maturase-specific domain-containing protein [Nitrospira sp. Kam-Ns4a]